MRTYHWSGLQRMSAPNRRLAVFIYLMASASAVGCTSVLAFPGNTTQLAGLGGAAGFIVACAAALIYVVRRWSTSRLLAPVPLLITILLLCFSFVAGRPIAKWWFVNVRLKQYEAAVTWIKAQPVPIVDNVSPEQLGDRLVLPPEHASLAYITEAHRHPDGTVVVLFAYSGAFPVKHFAYVYTSSGKWDDHIGRQWHGVRIAPQWFNVVD